MIEYSTLADSLELLSYAVIIYAIGFAGSMKVLHFKKIIEVSTR